MRRKKMVLWWERMMQVFSPSLWVIIKVLEALLHMWLLCIVTYSDFSWRHTSMVCILALLLEPPPPLWEVHATVVIMSWQMQFMNTLNLVLQISTCCLFTTVKIIYGLCQWVMCFLKNILQSPITVKKRSLPPFLYIFHGFLGIVKWSWSRSEHLKEATAPRQTLKYWRTLKHVLCKG